MNKGKAWSDSKQGYHMDAQRVYLFVCPNCGKEYIYEGGIMVRWCKDCDPPIKISEEIKRYRLFVVDDGDGFPYLDDKEDLHGEYVKYSDHKQIVDSMHNLLTEMCEDAVDNYIESNGTGTSWCRHCGEEQADGIVWHLRTCLVHKAEQYLQDTKEKS